MKMSLPRRAILAVFLAMAVAAFCPSSAWAQSRADIQRMIIEEARNSRVPPDLALAVARIESNFQPDAVSSAGARGVMQIMPKTARGVFGVHEDELWDARLNIQLGIDYLEQLYHQYGRRWDLALSHYNGGTLAGGAGVRAVPHAFTRKYVADVLHWRQRFGDQAAVWQAASKPDDSGFAPARTRARALSTEPSATLAGAGIVKPWRKTLDRQVREVRPWLGDDRERTEDDWASVERRRRLLRPTLDDFASLVTWKDG